MDFNQLNACLEHPLGILCRCTEYKNITNNFQIYTISTLSPVIPKFNIENKELSYNSVKLTNKLSPGLSTSQEPVASGTVTWVPRKTEKFREGNEPLVSYCKEERRKIDKDNVGKQWIPVKTDIVSPNYIRPNECYLHQSHMNTQSADTTTLTDMLPHRGRPIKRNDIRWDVGSHKTPIQMTDELETRWGKTTGCFTPWANAFTVSMGCPPF